MLTIKKYRLTQVAVDYAVGSVNQMVSHVCEELHVSVVRTLQNNDIPIPTELNDTFTLIDPFQGLATEYQQSKYYQEHFGLVVSSYLTHATIIPQSQSVFKPPLVILYQGRPSLFNISILYE